MNDDIQYLASKLRAALFHADSTDVARIGEMLERGELEEAGRLLRVLVETTDEIKAG